ncbi:MAG: rubredoxin-like domain-containing protein [Candidatus Nanoarchaeia archaeon]
MTKFYCEACGYSVESNTQPDRCPYCSKNGAMKKQESAEELLEEV